MLGVSCDRGGTRLASAGADATVRVWELDSPSPARVLCGHEEAVLGVQFGPAGDQLASTGNDGTTRLRNLAGGAPLILAGHEGPVYRVRSAMPACTSTRFSRSPIGAARAS